MSLPSKYAPEGISRNDSQRTITVNRRLSLPKHLRPSYVASPEVQAPTLAKEPRKERTQAVEEMEDIEMISIDAGEEERTISHVLQRIRASKQANVQYDMEIDAFESAPLFSSVADGNISYLVVDTNFMLAHLSIIDQLQQLAPKYQLRIIIPLTVMKELDGLKSSSRSIDQGMKTDDTRGKSIGTLARWANNWIYSVLAKNNMYVRGQKIRQRILPIHNSNDDSILDCCLYFYEQHPRNITVLLSNDKNLCAKALANSILTISYADDITPERIGTVVLKESIDRFGEIQNGSVQLDTRRYSANHVQQPVSVPDPVAIDALSSSTDVQDISTIIAQEIKILLKSVIVHCMEKEYGEELSLVRNFDRNNMKTLDDCATTIIRFWMPIFSSYFKKSTILPFKREGNNKKSTINTDIPMLRSEATEFVEFWCDVLTILYSQIMTAKQCEDLALLEDRWRSLIKN